MDRLTLERRQVWIYLAAIVGGLILGSQWPDVEPYFEALLWPVLAALLYTTFVQVPLLHVRDAFRDRRFVLAILLGNFVLIPLVAWLALQWLPDDPALHLGVPMVLLVPCTDWFITFTQLGRGSIARAIAVTPLNLLVQLLLLPVYLWLMLPAADFSTALKTEEMLPAALALIGLPLVAAALTERWVEARSERDVWRKRLGWWPVPLLALVVFLIAGAQGRHGARCRAGTAHGTACVRRLPARGRVAGACSHGLAATADGCWADARLQPRHPQFLRRAAVRAGVACRLGDHRGGGRVPVAGGTVLGWCFTCGGCHVICSSNR